MRWPIDLPKSALLDCISRTVGLLAGTSGPESIRSPPKLSQLWARPVAAPKESPATRWLAHRPETLSLFYVKVSPTILALPGQKTIDESEAQQFWCNEAQLARASAKNSVILPCNR